MPPEYSPAARRRRTIIQQPQYRRLAVTVRPIAGETLKSYLGRLTEQNLLRPSYLLQLRRVPHFIGILCILTGFSEERLASALPELRTPETLLKWQHLIGEVSANAGTRPACAYCVAGRAAPNALRVIVFASHEQLICRRHYRWVGSGELKCHSAEQVSVKACPEISAANMKHRLLIRRWGRGPTRASFYDAVTCVATWSRLPALMYERELRERWKRLGITDVAPPLRPPEIAALYPNAVNLTESILQERKRLGNGSGTRGTERLGIDRIKQQAVAGLATCGAWDPYQRAIFDARLETDAEVEAAPNETL